MIATRRGLGLLAALTLALAILLGLDVRHERGPVDHALLPGFDEGTARQLRWAGPPQGPAFGIERGADNVWRRTGPPGELDQHAVEALLATLRGARWHRRDKRAAAGPTPSSIEIDGTKIMIGLPSQGEQQWVAIDDTGYLVDAWLVRAIMPRPLDLSITRPLAAAPNAPSIGVGDLRIEGFPRRIVAPSPLMLDPTTAHEFEQTLADLEIIDLPDHTLAAAPGGHGYPISLAGTTAVLFAECPGKPTLAYLTTPSGGGCVRKDVADRLISLVHQFATAPEAVIAHAIAPFDVTKIELVDGNTLDLTKQPRITLADGTRIAVDPDKVTELLSVLATPATYGPVPRAAPTGHMTLTAGAATIGLDLVPLPYGGAVRRDRELATLRISPTAWTILHRGAAELRDLALWLEDPTTITAVTIDAKSFARGPTLGEWTNTGNPGAVDVLVTMLAAPRAISIGPAPRAPRTTITFTVTPPVGAPTQHVIEVGALTPRGCPAQIAGESYLLPAALCNAIAAAET